MRKHFQKTVSTMFAMALLGSAVMLSVSSAEGPYRHAGQNAFDERPLGYPDKALIQARWLEACESETAPSHQTAFDWQLNYCDACPKCGFNDSQVTPVVLDVPELVGPGDATAIEVIKRKLGINAFRGSIFEEPDFSAVQVINTDAPPKLGTSICERLSPAGACSSTTCGTWCDACETCWTAVTGDTAANTNNEACSSQERCAAGSECSRAGPECDPACNGSGDCRCATQSRTNIDVAHDGATYSSRGPRDFVSAIEEDAVAPLRRASLDLDEAAMRLEVVDRYAQADALREAAQNLRIKARQLKKGAGVATTSSSCDSAVRAARHTPATQCQESVLYPVTSEGNGTPDCFQSPSGTQAIE